MKKTILLISLIGCCLSPVSPLAAQQADPETIRMIEMLYENESLSDDLKDDAAIVLLGWAENKILHFLPNIDEEKKRWNLFTRIKWLVRQIARSAGREPSEALQVVEVKRHLEELEIIFKLP